MTNNSKAIITSASNKFFPSLLNFIGSIKKNYPDHPPIYIYNLGLNFIFKKHLEKIDGVNLLEIPKFVEHWRSCYTWKTYILKTPIETLNIYLDAGCQILKPLDTLFDKVNINNYLLVSQGSEVSLRDITPLEYTNILNVSKEYDQSEVIAAGIFGFKKDTDIEIITNKLYNLGVMGLCLGFSKIDKWKNKGVNKNIFTRECRMFRHDTTLITLLVRKYIKNPTIEPVLNFSGEKTDRGEQFIWNLRMNYFNLSCLNSIDISKCDLIFMVLIKIYIQIFLTLKKINSLKFILK